MAFNDHIVRLQRYWSEDPLNDNSNPLMYDEESIRKYFKWQPLENWIDDKILFLIGQAGSGKSTYLDQHYNNVNSLYISLKNVRECFAEDIETESKWINFCHIQEEDPKPFQLYLDGWDELNDIISALKNLRKILESIPSDKRALFRLRIASRPGLQMEKIFDEVKRRADWIIAGENSDKIKCLYLGGLCRDQAIKILQAFAPDKKGEDYWRWCYDKNTRELNSHVQSCIFLISSFLNPTSQWTNLPELWEEMIGYKIEPDVNNKASSPFSTSIVLDCLGEIALAYLLGERDPIPHPDKSSEIWNLPTLKSTQTPDKVKILLENSIFTPSGINDIRFAQSQEAEFLAARKLFKADIGIDNIRKLFVYHDNVPNPLQGLAKWIAKFDVNWREYLKLNIPDLAVQSLDNMQSEAIRDEVLQAWAKHPKSHMYDWGTLIVAMDVLPKGSIPWIVEDLVNQIKNNSKESREKLEILLTILDNRRIDEPILVELARYTQEANLAELPIQRAAKYLAAMNWGDKAYWENLLEKTKTDIEKDFRYAIILPQLKRCGIELNSLLKELGPVPVTSSSSKYFSFLEDLLSSIQQSDWTICLEWAIKQNFLGHDKYHWMTPVFRGLLKAAILHQSPQEVFDIAKIEWKSCNSLDSLFEAGTRPEIPFESSFVEYALSNPDNASLFANPGLILDPWLNKSLNFEKVINCYEKALEEGPLGGYSNSLHSILRWNEDRMPNYLNKLSSIKAQLENCGKYEISLLREILGPWYLNEKRSTEAKEFFMHQRDREQEEKLRNVREMKNKEEKLKWIEKNFEMINSMNWIQIYGILLISENIETSYHGFDLNPIDMQYWNSKLSEVQKSLILAKAHEYCASLAWNPAWSENFAKYREDFSYRVSPAIQAPHAAWNLLCAYKQAGGYASELWLKCLWCMDEFTQMHLTTSHWELLLQGVIKGKNPEEAAKLILSIWFQVKDELGKKAIIPDNLQEAEVSAFKEFLNALISKPSLDHAVQKILEKLIEKEGKSELLSAWFSAWLLKANEKAPYYDDMEILYFLLKHCQEDAWKCFLSLCEKDQTENIENHFQQIRIDRGNNEWRGLCQWSLKILGQVIEFMFRHFPPSSDLKHEGGYTVTWRDNIADFRRLLVQRLSKWGDPQSLILYEELCVKIPEFDPYASIQESIVQNISDEYYHTFNIRDIERLLQLNGCIIIANNEELTLWVARLLNEFNNEVLNGENSLRFALWDGAGKAAKPKEENALSDLVYHWLKWRSLKNPIIPLREVQVKWVPRKREPPEGEFKDRGMIMDIDIHLHSPKGNLRTLIEVKKDSNPECKKDGLNQLSGYLEKLSLTHGIYLIGNYITEGKRSQENGRLALKNLMTVVNTEIQEISKKHIFIIPVTLEI